MGAAIPTYMCSALHPGGFSKLAGTGLLTTTSGKWWCSCNHRNTAYLRGLLEIAPEIRSQGGSSLLKTPQEGLLSVSLAIVVVAPA